MGLRLSGLPKFLILEPGKGVRLEVELARSPACEIDVELDRPRPGRSFVVMVGHVGGPIVQRVRLAGACRNYSSPGKIPEHYVIDPLEPDGRRRGNSDSPLCGMIPEKPGSRARIARSSTSVATNASSPGTENRSPEEQGHSSQGETSGEDRPGGRAVDLEFSLGFR